LFCLAQLLGGFVIIAWALATVSSVFMLPLEIRKMSVQRTHEVTLVDMETGCNAQLLAPIFPWPYSVEPGTWLFVTGLTTFLGGIWSWITSWNYSKSRVYNSQVYASIMILGGVAQVILGSYIEASRPTLGFLSGWWLEEYKCHAQYSFDFIRCQSWPGEGRGQQCLRFEPNHPITVDRPLLDNFIASLVWTGVWVIAIPILILIHFLYQVTEVDRSR
jgi:hypothetical protein